MVEAGGIEPPSKTGFPSLPRASSLYYFSMQVYAEIARPIIQLDFF